MVAAGAENSSSSGSNDASSLEVFADEPTVEQVLSPPHFVRGAPSQLDDLTRKSSTNRAARIILAEHVGVGLSGRCRSARG